MNRKQYRGCLFALLALIFSLLYLELEPKTAKTHMEESVSVGEETAGANVNDATASELPKTVNTQAENNGETVNVHMVMPSGEPIGIYVKTKGVMIIDVGEVKASNGKKYSPCENLLKQGDYIVKIDGVEVEDKNDLIDKIEGSDGDSLNLEIVRDGDEMSVDVTPVLNENGNYMMGLWVKDDISGIGTLTYIDENGFGALGHSINDNDTGAVFTISDGAIYETNLVNIVKAGSDSPGRLEGLIDYSSGSMIGRVQNNGEYGISGYMTNKGLDMQQGEWMPVARKEEARLGDAYILSAVSGEPVYYQIEITGIDISGNNESKGIELTIKDERLLSLTSGIVQGMSGTPIIQDGKLLGAVTHVFLKDSTKGYGTFVESMMEE